jgi:regulatory protein RepA
MSHRPPHSAPTIPARMDILATLSVPPPPLDFVLPGFPTGTVGALIAPGATGKTLLLLQICMAVAAGLPVFDGSLFPPVPSAPAEPAKVVLIVAEETVALMHARLHAAFAELVLRACPDLMALSRTNVAKALDAHLDIRPLAGRYRMTLDSANRRSEGLAVLHELSEGARLVVIDPLRQFHEGDENDSGAMTKLVQDLQGLAGCDKRAVLVAHHANKWSTVSGAGDKAGASRGSAAFTDAVRWQLNMSNLDAELAADYDIAPDEMRQYVRLDLAKANYLPPQSPMVLRRGAGGAFSPLAARPQRPAAKAAKTTKGRGRP